MSQSSKTASQNPTRLAAIIIPLGLMAVVVLGLVWRFDPGQWHLSLCGLYVTTGLHCPGCGGTRATHHLLHGELLAALRYNALWVLLLPILGCAVVAEATHKALGWPALGSFARHPKFIIAVGIAAGVFFFLRNLPWEPFVYLAPPG